MRFYGCEGDGTTAACWREESLIACGCFEEVGKAGYVVVVTAEDLDFCTCDGVLADDASLRRANKSDRIEKRVEMTFI